ncbi:hypothetical protein Salat_0516900 [Sesamum alatum]|uniref:Uncharacterized protein n=1 Tax=Sesamum alatum TaxID=300844 RepID=A0AAE1Z426_9LAMI|nr:hypothetical protein Salat_0516900 [Sesamum alatum]
MTQQDLRVLLNKKRTNDNVGGVADQPSPDGATKQPINSSDGGSHAGASEVPTDMRAGQSHIPTTGQANNQDVDTMPSLETVEDPKGSAAEATPQRGGSEGIE